MKVVDSRLTPPRSLHGKKNLSVVWTPVGRLLCKSLGESVLDHYLLDSATLMKTRHQTPLPYPRYPPGV